MVERYFRTVDFDSLNSEAKTVADSRYGSRISAGWLFYENGIRCIAKRSLAVSTTPKIKSDVQIDIPANAGILFKSILTNTGISQQQISDIKEIMAILDIEAEEDYL